MARVVTIVALMLLTLRAVASVHVLADEGLLRVGGHVSTELGAHEVLEGAIEYLACSQGGKSYESVLVLDASPRDVYDGLLQVGLTPGSPATYDAEDNLVAPRGEGVTLMVEWVTDAGATVRMRAEDLVYNTKTERPMVRTDWVFTGSRMMEDPETEEQVLQAEMTGNVISTHQSDPSVLLQNPLVEAMDETSYQANQQTLPPAGAAMTLIFDASRPAGRRVLLSGKVQGVGFRAFTRDQAESLGATGYVEALAQGRRSVLDEMVRRLGVGPKPAEVTDVSIDEVALSGEHETFTIRY